MHPLIQAHRDELLALARRRGVTAVRVFGDIKGTEPQMPWRELSGFRNAIVHGYLGVDLGAV